MNDGFFEVLTRYFGDYLAQKKLSVQAALFRLALFFAAFFVFALLFSFSLLFLLYGAASGLGEVLGKEYLGYLATGGVLLAGLFLIWKIKSYQHQKAMRHSRIILQQTQKELLESIDISAWIQKHPWEATSIAAFTGFAASSQIYTSSPKDKENSGSEPSSSPSFLMPLGLMILGIIEKAATAFILDAYPPRTEKEPPSLIN